MNPSRTAKIADVTTAPVIVQTGDELRSHVAAARRAGKSIGLVPTMGAFHQGHVSLVEASCRECDFTVVTIFVNPTQFGPGEDYGSYPRSLDGDLAAMRHLPVDVVFTPSREEMYPADHVTRVELSGVALPLEGAHRPGHFSGVATIVLKLFNLATPDVAFFGQKDYQQTCVVRRMVEDLNVPVEIRVCPIVREADGLALSSRNAYLSESERRQALVLSRSLKLAEELVRDGHKSGPEIVARMKELFAAEPDVAADYVVLVEPDTLADVDSISGPVLAAVAAKVGKARLIDNRLLTPTED